MGVARPRPAANADGSSGSDGVRAAIPERRVRIGSFQTRALRLDGAGPVHVLRRGYADSADACVQVLGRLGRGGRAALALDLPGFAEAQPLAQDEPVLEQLTAFVLAAVRDVAAGGREVVLVGNSLGATAALLAAAEHARAITGVVAIAPGGL